MVTDAEQVKRWSEDIIDNYNDRHSDTVALIVSALLDLSAEQARITEVTASKVVFEVSDSDGTSTHEHLLPGTVSAQEDVGSYLLALVRQARATSPKAAITSLEELLDKNAALRTWPLSVVSAREITPQLRQITFRGDFEEFDYPGFDAFLFFIVPKPGETLPDDLTMADWRAMGADAQSSGAYYTIREMRESEMDVWFVIHESYGAVSNWARNAKAGMQVLAWGPRRAFEADESLSHYYLLGDETSYGAIAAMLDQLPGSAKVTAILEAQSSGVTVEMRQEPGWAVQWVSRESAAPGTGDPILEAVESLPPPPTDNYYIYGAAEAGQISKIKKFLKAAWGSPGKRMRLIGYWRRR